MFPQNTTNLSFAGVVKWILIVGSLPCFVKAYQGIVQRVSATSMGRTTGNLLMGDEALKYGIQNLLIALLFLASSWAVWFFWQRNEV